jgi:chemotaxis protein histidine kinase CheA
MDDRTYQVFVEVALVYVEEIQTNLAEISQDYSLPKFKGLIQAVGKLKSEATRFGVEEIQNPSDRLEKILQFMGEKQIVPDSELSQLLLQACDNLILVAIEKDESDPAEQVLPHRANALVRQTSVFEELETRLNYNLPAGNGNLLWEETELEKSVNSEIAGELMLFLDCIASQPQILIEEVLSWTGGQPLLTRKLCQLLLNAQSHIPAGEEAEVVKQLVQTKLLWQPTKVISEHFQTIAQGIEQGERDTAELLQLYRQVLEEDVVVDNSPLQQNLLDLGLVIKEQGKLKVANRIYQAIFNEEWVERELNLAQSDRLVKQPIPLNLSQPSVATEDLPASTNSTSALHLLVAILFGAVVFAVAAPQFRRQLPLVDNYLNGCDNNLLQKADNAIFLGELEQLQLVIIELASLRQRSSEALDVRCETKLYDAKYTYAIQLAATQSENLLPVVELLCQIPSQYYENKNIKPWFIRWSNMLKTTNFPQQLQQYLDFHDCPAATYLNRVP